MTTIPLFRKTYFGLGALIVAIISVFFLAGSYVITRMAISPATFSNLNNIIYLVYCCSTPLAFGLGAWGFTRKNDSLVLSVTAIGLVSVPFLVLFWQFAVSLSQSN